MSEIILAKYGEIALKGLNKNTFENVLVKNIKERLKKIGKFSYFKSQSTLYIRPIDGADIDEGIEAVKKVFGIATVSKALEADKDFDDIVIKTLDYFSEEFKPGVSFKVEAKRADKNFPMKSPEICRELGGKILEKYGDLRVDVNNPEITVTVEVRDEKAYIHGLQEHGAGGLPIGTSGKAMLLLSGGIDSPVAGYMMAKRGLKISAIHFISPPYTSERARMKVEQLCEKLVDYCGEITFYCVPFTEIQENIKRLCPEEYFTIIMRRIMMEIAQMVCETDNSKALITGESVGQVASQTLDAIVCTDAVCRMPVFRPLIGMDKTEIVNIARKIETFDISALPYEDCCTVFTPKHPKLKPKEEDVKKAEEFADFSEMINSAVENTERKKFYI